MSNPIKLLAYTVIILISAVASFSAIAHGVDEGTKQFLTDNEGVALTPFLYIGAKHMVTVYDHLLFLVGVLFFLYRSKDVLVYVGFLPWVTVSHYCSVSGMTFR